MSFLSGLENSPCFTKKELTSSFFKSKSALNKRILHLLKNHQLLQLKKGLYTTSEFYFNEQNKIKFAEFASASLYQPSYISLEYALKKHNLLNRDSLITCISTKTNRLFKNFLGAFRYSNVKSSLFFGFEKASFHGHDYYIATRAKALFDYLYLKPNLGRRKKRLKQQLFKDLGIVWGNFSRQDFEEFDRYVWKIGSKKMMDVWHIINEYFASKDFDKWASKLLNSRLS